MARSKIRAEQVVEDTLEDKDGNTKVSVEESANEDKIRFDTAGVERMQEKSTAGVRGEVCIVGCHRGCICNP